LTKENASTNPAFLENGSLKDDYGRGVEMLGLFDKERKVGFAALVKADCGSFALKGWQFCQK
jgi:hypothetical protein